jgi:hypothetical protein
MEKINLTPQNFHSEIFNLPLKIGVFGNDFKLIIEAYRRKWFLNSSNDMLGLGFPSEYKSNLFKPSFTLTPRVVNWWTLTGEGIEKMARLEAAIHIDDNNRIQINRLMYEGNF